MKIIATTSNDGVLVHLSREELSKVIGKSYYDDEVKAITDNKKCNAEYKLCEMYDNINIVKGVPAKLKKILKETEEFKIYLEKAIETSNKIDVLNDPIKFSK